MSKLAAAMAGNTAMREQTPYERLRGQIERLKPDIAALVGKDNVDRFTRVVLNAVQANPKTMSADRKSLFGACMKAAQDGLVPDGREAVFNIYNTKVKDDGGERWVETVQYLPMAYGMTRKLYDAGATYVDAVAVYERDGFKYQRGDDPKIEHVPYSGDEDPGKVIAAYCIVKMKTGEIKREVMFRRDIERVREKSKAPKGMMWADFYDQAAIKSVIKRICKQLPNSAEMDHVIAHDNEAEGIDGIPVAATSSSMDLQALVDGRLDQELARVPAAAAKPESAFTGAAPEVKISASAPEPEQAVVTGTAAQLKAFIADMESATDPHSLSIAADAANALEWDGESLQKINAVYFRRAGELST